MKSIWEGTAQDNISFPTLEGEHRTDVVIIGGGITGITAAYLLSRAGISSILLEAKKIGLGTTGHSTGNLYVMVDEYLSTIKKKWDTDVVKKIVGARGTALNFIEEIISTHQLDCNFSRQPFVYYAEDQSDKFEQLLEDECAVMEDIKLNYELTNDAGLPFTTKKALKIKDQAQFHPLKYVRELSALVGDNCKIFENSKAIEIDDETGVIKTANGSVRAEKILMATHTPKGALAIHSALGPYREFGIAAELNSDEFPGGIYWSLDSPKHSIRSLYNEGHKYVMVVGDKFKTGQHGNSFEHISGLESYLTDRVSILQPEFVWAGQQYRSADALPYIGKSGERTYYLTGFATDGLVYGTLASMIVTDEILNRYNPWAETFKSGRFTPLKSAKAIIKENLDNALEYLKDLPGSASSDDPSDIRENEGKVIEHKGEKLAVYKDAQGKLYTCSAVCTHMDCIVNWNKAEKSWDCPCHGSRFNYDGTVIEGPAITNLPKRDI